MERDFLQRRTTASPLHCLSKAPHPLSPSVFSLHAQSFLNPELTSQQDRACSGAQLLLSNPLPSSLHLEATMQSPRLCLIGPGNLAPVPHYITMVNIGHLSLIWVAHLFKWAKRYMMEKRGCVLCNCLADLYSSEAMSMGDIKIQTHHPLCIFILSVLILNGNLYSFALKVI